MKTLRRLLLVLIGGPGLIYLLAFAFALLIAFVGIPGFLPLMCLGLFYAWMISAFLHYRAGRQEEFRQLLITAAESQAPIAPLLMAYLDDRPHGAWRELWVGTLMFFVFPGYYWLWHRRHRFDEKVAEVARLLETGMSLSEALRSVHGVAPPETALAAAIGESTGNLAACLSLSVRQRLGTVWAEVLPRLLYPLIVFGFLSGVVAFWMFYIGPKMARLFQADQLPLPDTTLAAINVWNTITTHIGPLSLGSWVLAGVLVLLFSSSWVRWHFPGLGRVYRMEMQSRVLQMTGMLLGSGKPVPQSLAILSESGYFSGVVRHRIDGVRLQVEHGEPFAASMRRLGLLPRSMVSLVEAAERVRNVPWALGELSTSLGNRAVRIMRRFSLVVFPSMIFAVGALTGLLVVGFFLPLVKLISAMSR